MANKPIDKDYLISSLKEFDKRILSEKYGKKSQNQSTLDKLSESDDGILLFNGREISEIAGNNGKSVYDIAVDNGFEGTEQEYLDSLKGEKGQDGTTPHIDTTSKHWMIGDTDTGIVAEGKNGADGQDGRSITSITTDQNENIIVSFSDGTTQNIGKLNVDIQADFLTQNGFGNIRYYNNAFQYYNVSTSSWVNIVATVNNQLIVELSPNPMQKMNLTVDVENKCYKIIFKEPADTVIDGQLVSAIEGIKFVRKLGSEPADINDGTLVLDYKRRDFGKYDHKVYSDLSFEPNNGENWFYKAFPYSTSGFISDSSMNAANAIFKNYYLYAFKIDQNESDPSSMITYPDDCDNAYFQPVYMDYSKDTFNYGDWWNAWFIKKLKPCMLNYDGTVAYELNPNDYSQKKDGTVSDIANANFAGNAMVGIPKVYWKIVDNGDDTANVYVSDKKVDNDFHCWSHIDNNGNEIPYCYMPAYNGSNVSNKLRSLSEKTPIYSQNAQAEINYAKANNLTNDTIWYTEVFSDRMLINLLLLLIGKSTDTKKVFGSGNNNSYVSTSNTGIKVTGTMNTKGLFWGNQDNKTGVKVFGIEHHWGNQWRRIAGLINDKGTQKVKMTYGKSDGSTVDGYNLDGNRYITIPNATPSGTNGGYINKIKFTENGLIPVTANGSATTYYPDGLWFNNSQNNYAFVGGISTAGLLVGALSSALNSTASYAYWNVGAALSCKPLA